jgi:hypothetical protein
LASGRGIAGVGFGALSLLVGVVIAIADSTTLGRMFAAGWIAFGLLLLAIPVRSSVWIAQALRTGIMSTAVITTLESLEAPSRRSLGAMRNGYATGLRRVRHPLGEFDQRFVFDGIGAGTLHVGSVMRVLTAPAERRVLLDLE